MKHMRFIDLQWNVCVYPCRTHEKLLVIKTLPRCKGNYVNVVQGKVFRVVTCSRDLLTLMLFFLSSTSWGRTTFQGYGSCAKSLYSNITKISFVQCSRTTNKVLIVALAYIIYVLYTHKSHFIHHVLLIKNGGGQGLI